MPTSTFDVITCILTAISETNYIMHFAELAGVFVESNRHNHYYPQSGPQQDWKVEGSLPWAVHLVLQVDTADNMSDHFL